MNQQDIKVQILKTLKEEKEGWEKTTGLNSTNMPQGETTEAKVNSYYWGKIVALDYAIKEINKL